MPRSKRDKKVSLTALPNKKAITRKMEHAEEIRKCATQFENIFVFSAQNFRTSLLKQVRQDWLPSRFLLGKNTVISKVLGRDAADELRPKLHKLSKCLKGQTGLLFTNSSKQEVVNWFASYGELDYARAGNIAKETVIIEAGPLLSFAHSREPELRKIGLPVTLEKGVIHLNTEYTVCRVGDILKPEQTTILKWFNHKMAEFKLELLAMWSQDGSFEKFKLPKADAVRKSLGKEVRLSGGDIENYEVLDIKKEKKKAEKSKKRMKTKGKKAEEVMETS